MKRNFSFLVLLMVIIGLMFPTLVLSQSYTVSPSSWVSAPTSNYTVGSRTYHGNLIEVKATVSGSTATFTLRKNDGSKFQYKGNIVIRLNKSFPIGCTIHIG